MQSFREKWENYIQLIQAYANSRGRTQRILIRTSLAIILAVATLYLHLYRIEAFFYDARMNLKGAEPVDSRIELVVLEHQDRKVMERLHLTPMRAHLTALKRLLREKPAAIAYFNRFSPSKVQGEWDVSEEFVDLVREAESRGIKVFFGTDVDLTGEILPPYPLSLLPHFPATLHKDGVMFAEDKVMRRALLTVPETPSLHLKLAYMDQDVEQLKKTATKVRGAYHYEPSGAWHSIIRFSGSTHFDENTFSTTSFSDLLMDQGSPLAMEGKIILVGRIHREEIADFNYTAYSRDGYTNPKIFSHASILDSLLKDKGIIVVPRMYDAFLTFSLCLLLIYFALRFTPTQGVFCLLATSVLLFAASLLLFKMFGLWINLVHPLFAIFCTYYLVVPYRAILEYKKRWKVQEQHDLLIQVEEMKGNFLSLMSHDLKTPVARIQGLAELVLKQGKLTDDQSSEMNEIIINTDSLNKFITKILELTKIESSNIKINSKSKDINKVIEKCVQKLEFQANRRDIKLNLELEPLFPINIDAALIIQVLTNLIDNAVQYSPEGSTIEICSREIDDYVQVSIKDDGEGMNSNEKKMLFTKFYRGENPAASKVKGSGLGLYLSKYFIELHSGTIAVKSEKGIGSTFTISLPIATG